jgi:hypothetical protein
LPTLSNVGLQVKVISGEGQWVGRTVGRTDPLVIQVTNAQGSPVANAPVVWTSSVSYPISLEGLRDPVGFTQTDANGMATNRVLMLPQDPALELSTVVSTIVTATVNGGPQAYFHATGYGVSSAGLPAVLARYTGISQDHPPVYKLGGAGAPIKVTVENFGGRTIDFSSAKISVLFYADQAIYPQIGCQEDDGIHKGQVFIEQSGVATCTPSFRAAGSGTFTIRIGGNSLNYTEFRNFPFSVNP